MASNTITADDNRIYLTTDGDSGKISADDNKVLISSNATSINIVDNGNYLTVTYNPVPPNTNTYFSEKYITLPDASQNTDHIVQYIGETNEYINGYFYKSDGSTWKAINVQATPDFPDLSIYARTDVENTYNGQQIFQHSTYAPTAIDIAYGIGVAYKASRGCVGQEIVAQIIMPSTTVSDSKTGITSVKNTLPITYISTVNATKPTLKEVGKFTTTGWNGGATLTGTPTAPTAASGTSTTQIATTKFVSDAITDTKSVISETYQKQYKFGTLSSNTFTAENSYIYELTLTADQATEGLNITLPYSSAYTQDFIIRLDTLVGATQIASISQTATDGTTLSFDWPKGDMMTVGSLVAGVYYVTFTQVGRYRWRIGYYKANS